MEGPRKTHGSAVSGSANVEELLSPVAIDTMIGIGTTRQP
jgi:hypothetical protein